MPRKKDKVTSISAELEKSVIKVEPEEQVDLEDNEDSMEEEVEYEEVEEFEEEDEEDEEDDEETTDDRMDVEPPKNELKDQDINNKHAELLALPPHESEVYVGGIPHDATEDDLRGFFEAIGEVTEVRIMKGKDSGEHKGYAFVAFKTKEFVSKAIDDLNNTEFMKPLLPAYPLHGYGGMMGVGYGFAGNYGVPSPFGQIMMYGRGTAGSSPAGVAMVPMVLPDGRLGYVFQQPGVSVHPSMQRGGSRGGSSGATKASGGSRGWMYHPY